MTTTTPRGPTPSEIKVQRSVAFWGTIYPVIDFHDGPINRYLSKERRDVEIFKRITAEMNPFALQQVPTSAREAVGIRCGPKWYRPDPYPSRITFSHKPSPVYDPFQEPHFKELRNVKHPSRMFESFGFKVQHLPRFCQRPIAIYRRCLMTNDDQRDKCIEEEQNILATCPKFALEGLRNMKIQKLKNEAFNNKRYWNAMAISDYNTGRTVANAKRKSWIEGTRQNLRPDTFWADDRYIDITQADINAAKKRNQARGQKENPNYKLKTRPYDRTYEKPPSGMPLYP